MYACRAHVTLAGSSRKGVPRYTIHSTNKWHFNIYLHAPSIRYILVDSCGNNSGFVTLASAGCRRIRQSTAYHWPRIAWVYKNSKNRVTYAPLQPSTLHDVGLSAAWERRRIHTDYPVILSFTIHICPTLDRSCILSSFVATCASEKNHKTVMLSKTVCHFPLILVLWAPSRSWRCPLTPVHQRHRWRTSMQNQYHLHLVLPDSVLSRRTARQLLHIALKLQKKWLATCQSLNLYAVGESRSYLIPMVSFT